MGSHVRGNCPRPSDRTVNDAERTGRPGGRERTVPAPDALTDLHPQRKEPIGYFPSDHEIAAARRLLERRARNDARSQLFFEAVPENGGKVTSKHPDVLVSQLSLMNSFSTGYVHVSDALLTQLTKISCRDHDQDVSGRALAQAVAMVQGIAPRNETEAMLAVQMVAIHNAALATAARFGEANTREQQQAVALRCRSVVVSGAGRRKRDKQKRNLIAGKQ